MATKDYADDVRKKSLQRSKGQSPPFIWSDAHFSSMNLGSCSWRGERNKKKLKKSWLQKNKKNKKRWKWRKMSIH